MHIKESSINLVVESGTEVRLRNIENPSQDISSILTCGCEFAEEELLYFGECACGECDTEVAILRLNDQTEMIVEGGDLYCVEI
jgi:hypothetical protein